MVLLVNEMSKCMVQKLNKFHLAFLHQNANHIVKCFLIDNYICNFWLFVNFFLFKYSLQWKFIGSI